jgi:hypothetical protein
MTQQVLKFLPETPTEEMWGQLSRDIVMWMDMYEGSKKTPRNLFTHLERLGRDIPQWLKDEPEMKNLDSVPSKGTRVVIIYKSMWHACKPHLATPADIKVNSGALQLAINSLQRGTSVQKEIAAELIKTIQ